MNLNELQLNGIFIKDPDTGHYTTFFAEIPNVIAEGKTEKEALKNLISLMKIAAMDKVSEFQHNMPKPENYESKAIKFHLSV
jgi:predicted RNase H-like HicB family nuclease